MLVAEQRRSGQRQMERRAKAARRSSRLRYPKTAARELHQSRAAHKNQNPQNGQLMARFDWGLGAVCFGASPVAAVFGSAPGSATPPEHRIQFKPSSQAALPKQDISTLLGIGHFYFALTALALDEERLHLLVLQDLHGCLLGSVALRDRQELLLRLRHHRARQIVLVDGVVFGRHGPVQQWHDVVKDARRVGVAENDGGTVHAKEVELDGLDSLLLLADDLRVLHPGRWVRAHSCHEPAYPSASSLGGAAKGLRVDDFDFAHLVLG